MRRKIAQLEEALDCSFFTDEHAFVLAMMLANIDHLTAQVKELSDKIAVLCEPYARQIAQLDAVPGFGVITAQDIIAEIGVDMSVFPTAGHLCSWARQAPQVASSAGKRKGKNATGRGNPYIGGTLGEAAVNAGRTQTFLGTKFYSRDLGATHRRAAVVELSDCARCAPAGAAGRLLLEPGAD